MDFRDTKDCDWFPIKTLTWEKEKRGWSTVGYLQHSGSFLTLKEIFPNSKMGFNKRKFLVGTLPVSHVSVIKYFAFVSNCLFFN